MPLTATADPGHHHFANDTVYFYMNDGPRRARCGISRLAPKVLEPEIPLTKQGRMQAFIQHRIRIEQVASSKFDRGQLEPDGSTVSCECGLKCAPPTRWLDEREASAGPAIGCAIARAVTRN